MQYEAIGFVGCALVSLYSICNCFADKKNYHYFLGVIGSICIIIYSYLNHIWPTLITNSVLLSTICIMSIQKQNIECRKIQNMSA